MLYQSIWAWPSVLIWSYFRRKDMILDTFWIRIHIQRFSAYLGCYTCPLPAYELMNPSGCWEITFYVTHIAAHGHSEIAAWPAVTARICDPTSWTKHWVLEAADCTNRIVRPRRSILAQLTKNDRIRRYFSIMRIAYVWVATDPDMAMTEKSHIKCSFSATTAK